MKPLRLKRGYITADKECWTLNFYHAIDKENKSEKQLENIKNDFAVKTTYYGTLEQAIKSYCESALKDVEPEIITLLQALEGLRNEISEMNLSSYKRY